MKRDFKETTLTWITFLTSTTTLLCCTLPILFIMLGLGTVLAFLTTQLHWWITLAQYKFWLFLVSSLLLLFSYWTIKKSGQSCPADPKLAAKCQRLRVWNFRILRVSFLIWIIGFISAYVALPIRLWLGI